MCINKSQLIQTAIQNKPRQDHVTPSSCNVWKLFYVEKAWKLKNQQRLPASLYKVYTLLPHALLMNKVGKVLHTQAQTEMYPLC